SKMRENLIEHADRARLSRQRVELISDAPLPEPLDDLAVKGIPREPSQAFLEEHGFKSRRARLGVQAQAAAPAAAVATAPVLAETPEPAIDRSLYETVADEAALDAWLTEIRTQGHVAIDTETDGRDSVSARLVGISLATAP